MIVSTKERISTYQRMFHDERVRQDASAWAAEEVEELYGLDFFGPRGWSPVSIDATEFGEDLAFFSERVRKVAAVFGPPDKVSAEHWHQSSADVAPDLEAVWNVPLDRVPETKKFLSIVSVLHGAPPTGPLRKFAECWPNLKISVRVMSPAGCKVDPRSEYVAPKTQKIHPECAAVLAELEDVGAEAPR